MKKSKAKDKAKWEPLMALSPLELKVGQKRKKKFKLTQEEIDAAL